MMRRFLLFALVLASLSQAAAADKTIHGLTRQMAILDSMYLEIEGIYGGNWISRYIPFRQLITLARDTTMSGTYASGKIGMKVTGTHRWHLNSDVGDGSTIGLLAGSNALTLIPGGVGYTYWSAAAQDSARKVYRWSLQSNVPDGSTLRLNPTTNSIEVAPDGITYDRVLDADISKLSAKFTVDCTFDLDSTTHVLSWPATMAYGVRTSGSWRWLTRSQQPLTISSTYGMVYVHMDSLTGDSLKVLYTSDFKAMTFDWTNNRRIIPIAWRQNAQHSCPYRRNIIPADRLTATALDRLGKITVVDHVFDYDSTTHVVKWAAGLVYGIKTNSAFRWLARYNSPITISDAYGCIYVHADSLKTGTDSLKVIYNSNLNAVTNLYGNTQRYVILAWRQNTRHSCPFARSIPNKIAYGEIAQEAIDKLSANPAILKVFDLDSATHVLSWPTFFMPGLKFSGSVNRWVSATGSPMTLSGTYSLAYFHADSLVETDKLKVLYDSNWMDNTLAWFNNHKIQVIAIRSDANHSCHYQREKDYDAMFEEATHSGESIAWFGTSIPYTGYPQLVGTALNMTIYNEAQGSSMVRSSKDTGSMVGMQYTNVIYSFTHTDAEKDSIIAHWSAHLNADGTFNWAGSYGWRDLLIGSPPSSLDAPTQALIIAASYENKLKKKYLKTTDPAFVCWPTYYIFDHGHNDLAVAGYDTSEATAITVPTWNRDTRAKYIGAMSFILDTIFYYNPRARVALIGHYESQKVTAIYKAQNNLAETWSLPICRLWEKLGWSQQTITTTGYWDSGTWHDSGGSPQSLTMTEVWMEDDLHPTSTAAKQLIANIITQWFRTVF